MVNHMDYTKANKQQLLTIALSENCPIEDKYRAVSELESRKAKIFVEDGIEYNLTNRRMRYNPEFHDNHGKAFTVKEVAYLCSMWEGMSAKDIAMALGRTHSAILQKVNLLRKNGEFDYYKNLGEKLGA